MSTEMERDLLKSAMGSTFSRELKSFLRQVYELEESGIPEFKERVL